MLRTLVSLRILIVFALIRNERPFLYICRPLPPLKPPLVYTYVFVHVFVRRVALVYVCNPPLPLEPLLVYVCVHRMTLAFLRNPPPPLKPSLVCVCVHRKTSCPGVGEKQCKSTRFLEHGEHRYSDYQEVKFFFFTGGVFATATPYCAEASPAALPVEPSSTTVCVRSFTNAICAESEQFLLCTTAAK